MVNKKCVSQVREREWCGRERERGGREREMSVTQKQFCRAVYN